MLTLLLKVANVRTLSELPKSTKFNTLIAEPDFMRLKIDIVEPICMFPRREKVDPSMEKSNTLNELPSLVQAKQLVALPNLPVVRRDRHELIDA
jgi:hypothetical protein